MNCVQYQSKKSLFTGIGTFVFLVHFAFAGATTPAMAQGAVSLPQTGQTKCYTGVAPYEEKDCLDTGQDGEFRAGVVWPTQRFVVGSGAESDCVTDTLTGLMWAKSGNYFNKTSDWGDALYNSEKLTLCGHSDWRLPNTNELKSLINYGQADSAAWLNTAGFTGVQSGYYWSSTSSIQDGDETPEAWNMSMEHGSIYTAAKSLSGNIYAWPVRGATSTPAALPRTGQKKCYWYESPYTEFDCSNTGQDGQYQAGIAWPTQRFVVGTGTKAECVTDNLTGLMWARNANLPNGARTWQGALDFANTLTICDYSDWRLPNPNELLSLMDRSQYNPALPGNHPFTNVSMYTWFWSSTTYAKNPANAVLVWNGTAYGTGKGGSAYVWPVTGAGPGAVTYGVDANGTTKTRSGSIFVTLDASKKKKTFAVRQLKP